MTTTIIAVTDSDTWHFVHVRNKDTLYIVMLYGMAKLVIHK